MASIRRLGILAALLLVCALPTLSLAADDKPLAMSDINRMLEADQSPQQVVEAMAKRGVGFRMNSTAEKRLEKWGFSEAQIDLVRKIAAGEAVDLSAKPEVPNAADPAGPGPAGANDDNAFKVGYPSPDNFHSAEQQRIERAIKNAGLNYKRIELSRCTLYTSDARARELVPVLKKLEADLIARFPESIRNASSPKSAHIVIVDHESDWRNWVTACFDSYEADRINFRFSPEDDDPRPGMIRGSGYFLPNCAVVHADKYPSEETVARTAAFAVGYLMMGQAGGPKRPDGLQTGFGDLAEAMAFKTPSVMVTSYGERDLGEAGTWKTTVLQRFKDKKITNPTHPWAYDTQTMSAEHYAEAWSLVSTLAEAPDKFAEAVAMVRDSGKPMGEAVAEVYQLDNRKLLEAWYTYVSR